MIRLRSHGHTGCLGSSMHGSMVPAVMAAKYACQALPIPTETIFAACGDHPPLQTALHSLLITPLTSNISPQIHMVGVGDPQESQVFMHGISTSDITDGPRAMGCILASAMLSGPGTGKTSRYMLRCLGGIIPGADDASRTTCSVADTIAMNASGDDRRMHSRALTTRLVETVLQRPDVHDILRIMQPWLLSHVLDPDAHHRRIGIHDMFGQPAIRAQWFLARMANTSTEC